jgi:hypothetical protein
VKVEIGAGARAQPGWLAFDLNPANADVLADALHIPLADATVTDMRAVDVLEHISYRYTDAALCEWRRVCVDDADLYVQVPDAHQIMAWYIARDSRLAKTDAPEPVGLLDGAQWRLLGGHADGKYVDEGGDWRWNAHYSLWSGASLIAALDRAGFDVYDARMNAHPNILCHAQARPKGT